MLCEKCNQRQATTLVKQAVNGQEYQYHLCSQCASQLGYSNILSAFHFDMSDMLGSFLGSMPAVKAVPKDEIKCQFCGSTYSDIVKLGKMGCPQCYGTFGPEMTPTLQRIHGKTKHTGKIPKSAGPRLSLMSRIAELKTQLSKAIEIQDFENAATYRDQIKALEGEMMQNGEE